MYLTLDCISRLLYHQHMMKLFGLVPSWFSHGELLDSPMFYSTNMTLPWFDLSNTDTSSASEDEGSLRRQGRLPTSTPYQGHSHPTVEHWFNRVIQGSSTSSSASSTSSHPGGRSITNTTTHAALNANATATALADFMAHTQLGQ